MNVRRGVVALLLGASLVLLTAAAWGATNSRVEKIVMDVVKERGSSIIGLGSWISGTTYRDPLTVAQGSDHDLRLLMPKGTPPGVAAQEWQAVRARIQDAVRKEFGAEAGKVLDSINLYPPTQLMVGVEGIDDAVERFVEYKQVPNLGFSRPVTPQVDDATLHRLSEGLYGDGAAAWTQSYERSAGRLYYRSGNEAYSGLAELAHLSEGSPPYTVSGSANTATQWVDHLDDALRTGNAKSTSKYLDRLQRDVRKARDLARCPADVAYLREMQAAARELEKNPRALGPARQRLRELMVRAQTEAQWLRRFERADSAQKQVIKSALAGLESNNGFGKALRQAAAKVPLDVLVQGVMVAVATYETAWALGENDANAALASAQTVLLPLGPSLLGLLTNAILNAAREGGYDLMAASQSAANLLAGIFTAGGRADTNVKSYTLEQLVGMCETETQLQAFVLARAQQAADRGWDGPVTRQADEGVAQAIYRKCYPVILQGWRATRERLLSEYAAGCEQLMTGGLCLAYKPVPVVLNAKTKSAQVTVVPTNVGVDRAAVITRLKTIMAILVGKRTKAPPFVTTSYYWLAPGAKTAVCADGLTTTIKGPGRHTVAVTCAIVTGAAGLPAGHPLARRMERKASVDIIAAGPPPAPVRAPVSSLLARLQKMPRLGCRWNANTPDGASSHSYPQNSGRDPKPTSALTWNQRRFSYRFEEHVGTPTNVTTVSQGKQVRQQVTERFGYVCKIEGEVSPDGRLLKTVSISERSEHVIPSCSEEISGGSLTLQNLTLVEQSDDDLFRFAPAKGRLASSIVHSNSYSSGYYLMLDSKYDADRKVVYFQKRSNVPGVNRPIASPSKFTALDVSFTQ